MYFPVKNSRSFLIKNTKTDFINHGTPANAGISLIEYTSVHNVQQMYTMYSCKGHASGFKKQAICVKIWQKTRFKHKYNERIRNFQVSTGAGHEICRS